MTRRAGATHRSEVMSEVDVVTEATDEVHRLERALRACAQLVVDREERYEALANFCFGLQRDYEDLIEALRDEVDALRRTEAQHDVLENFCFGLEREYESSQSRLRASQLELERLNRELLDERDSLERTESQHEILENFCFGLEQEYERSQAQLRAVQSDLARAHAQLEHSYDDLKKDQALREIELKRIEVELEMARVVQRMLIPTGPPNGIHGVDVAISYLSATETSGDWIGFDHDRDNRQLGILIGDVTGHGLAPALVTAGVFAYFSALRSLTDEGAFDRQPSIERKLAWLDHVVQAMGQGALGMSFFASYLDYESRTVQYCSWGHPPPYLIRPKELTETVNVNARRHIRSLSARGPLLGMQTRRLPTVHSMKLEPGDLLVFYTDGVVENARQDGKCVGERLLRRWLVSCADRGAEDACALVRARLREFLGESELRDDMAMVFAKIE